MRSSHRSDRPTVWLAAIVVGALGSGCGTDETAAGSAGEGPAEGAIGFAPGLAPEELADRVEQFAPVTLTFDETLLDARQRTLLRKLVEASDVLDALFLRQVWEGNPELRDRLSDADFPGVDAARDYFDIMYGPWDRLEEDEPFLAVGPKPPGAGYYDEDLSKEEIDAWLDAHPEDRDAFGSYFTVIRRDGEALRAIPYAEAHAEELGRAAALLHEAAELADNESLRHFLRTRANAFLSNDYFESDVAWMRLEDNLIDPTIGPYEVYEDRLFGYKAAFESFLTIRDPAESAKLEGLAGHLPELEAALPVADEHKYLDRPFTAPIAVVTEVYAAGDTRAGVQTLAFNLPNDAVVREQEGSKKVMLTNIIEAKFEKILRPIAQTVMEPEQAAEISFEPFYTSVLMHELAHGLGPDYVTGQPDLTVNKALSDRYSASEEAKADVVGVHSLGVLTERGEYDEEFLRQVYLSHAASLFRCVRFGVTEAHGKGCLMQFNYFSENGALVYDEATGTFRVDLETMPTVVSDLAGIFLTYQATGDYDGLGQFMERYGTVPETLRGALERLEAVPVDIRPSYAVRELMRDW